MDIWKQHPHKLREKQKLKIQRVLSFDLISDFKCSFFVPFHGETDSIDFNFQKMVQKTDYDDPGKFVLQPLFYIVHPADDLFVGDLLVSNQSLLVTLFLVKLCTFWCPYLLIRILSSMILTPISFTCKGMKTRQRGHTFLTYLKFRDLMHGSQKLNF